MRRKLHADVVGLVDELQCNAHLPDAHPAGAGAELADNRGGGRWSARDRVACGDHCCDLMCDLLLLSTEARRASRATASTRSAGGHYWALV